MGAEQNDMTMFKTLRFALNELQLRRLKLSYIMTMYEY